MLTESFRVELDSLYDYTFAKRTVVYGFCASGQGDLVNIGTLLSLSTPLNSIEKGRLCTFASLDQVLPDARHGRSCNSRPLSVGESRCDSSASDR